MAFNPSSMIFLCNVPFDNSYKHVVRFTNRSAQNVYFNGKTVKTFSNYYTVRKVMPTGELRSSVKVEANIDELRSLPCNYMWYRNDHHGERVFYAFITELIYINEETTEIVFETDVFQTWFFDCEMLPSYVVREHSNTDVAGDNVVPENFIIEDYVYTNLGIIPELTNKGYLIVASEKLIDVLARGYEHSGVYQGLYFYFAKTTSEVNNILDQLEEKGSDCIVSITPIPKFCVTEGLVEWEGFGYVALSQQPATLTHTINMSAYALSFDGYLPKNNKLFTAPFTKLIVSNHSGEEAEYTIEDFYGNSKGKPTFKLFGDVSPVPSIMLYPTNYKGVTNAVDFSISLSGFPQCAFNNDTYKLWLNKNWVNLTANAAAAGVSAIGGAIAGGPIGAAMGVANVASTVASTIGEMHAASKEPNQAHIGSPRNNLLTAIGQNTFSFYTRHIKRTYAETIDDYFTMFGYQTNRVKSPNLWGRPYFNYVQTIDCNIVGGIPSDDMQRLKAVFNGGVTLWAPSATVGDYTYDNSPKA